MFLQRKPMDQFISFFGVKLPTIGDVSRGVVYSPLFMDSSSCGSCLRDHEKKPVVLSPTSMESSSSRVSYPQVQENNRDEGARNISSTVEAAARVRVFFPLTPDPIKKEDGNSRQETLSAQLKRKSMASPSDPGTLVLDKKAKCSRTQKEKKDLPGCDTEEDRRNGVSTELILHHDPYKIKKKLTQSDLGHLSRLLIGRDLVKNHLLSSMSDETVRQVEGGGGAEVIVRDVDTCSEHRLMFVYWSSSGSYVLKGGWIKEFVKRRGLVAGDEVGLYWDPIDGKFYFKLLQVHRAD